MTREIISLVSPRQPSVTPDSNEVIRINTDWVEGPRHQLPRPWEFVDRPSPDGRKLAFVDPDVGVSIIELHSGTQLALLSLAESPQVLAWHPRAQQVAVSIIEKLPTHQNQTITRVFDLESQAVLHEVLGRVAQQGFSPDGGLLVVHDYSSAQVVDIATSESVELPGEDCDWDEVLWHPSGRLLLPAEEPTVPVAATIRGRDGAIMVLDSSGSVRLWDRDGQQFGGFSVGDRPVEGVLRLTPDSTRVLLGCGAALEVRGLDGDLVAGLGHDLYPQDAAWSPVGTRVISSGRDGTVRVWDATTGEVLHTLSGGMPYGRVAVAWSPDGTEVMAGPLGESARSFQIWDPTGTRLATAWDDCAVRVWTLDSPPPVTRARQPPEPGHPHGVG